jgi:hypothetical protein
VGENNNIDEKKSEMTMSTENKDLIMVPTNLTGTTKNVSQGSEEK